MAGAQLGSFTYDMVLQYAKFEDAFTKAQRLADQHANAIKKSIQGAVDGIGDGLSEIANKVAGAFALEKLVEFGKQTIETADQIGKASQKIGLSVESLSALNVTANLANVSLDDLQGGMEKFSKVAAQAAAGNKEAAAAFTAIGVSVKDANGNVRSMQDLLGETAGKFAGYEASITKAADAQAFFGKSGDRLIPFLNDLGKEGFAGATEQAREFGQVISTETAKQAGEFNDNLTKLGLEAKGFANAVVAQLLPSLDRLSESWVEAGKTADGYNDSATTVANGAKYLVLALIATKEIIAAVIQTVVGFFDAVQNTFGAAGDLIKAWAEDTKKAITAAFHMDKAGVDAANADFKARVSEIGATFTSNAARINESIGGGWTQAFANATAASDALFNGLDKSAQSADHLAESAKKPPAPLIALGDAADKAGAQVREAAQAMDALDKLVTSISGKTGDQFTQAQSTFTNQLLALKDAAEAAAIAGGNVDEIITKWQAGEAAAEKQFAKTNKEIEAQADILGKFNRDAAADASLIGLSGRELAVAEAVKKVTEEYQRNIDEGKAVIGSLEDIQRGAAGTAAKMYDLSEKARLNAEATKEWQSIWVQAGNSVADTFAKVLVEGGSLFDSLKNLAKQTVEQIIAYFLRLQLINPLLNSIFGGQQGFSLMPSMANMAMGGGGQAGGGIFGAISNGLSTGGGGTSTAGGFQLFSPSSWLDAGKNLFSGFFGASAAAGTAGEGVLAGYGSSSAFAGSTASAWGSTGYGLPSDYGASLGGAAASPAGMPYGGYGSALGQGIGVAGGIYAGYNEFKNAGGGVAGAAGGLAYGVGTYYAGAAVSTALAGGLSAGLAAIPVVGWIALAAMLIDKFSGGKLFGTAWQTKASTTSFNLGADGGTASAFLSQQKQGALFSGKKYRDKSVDPGADAQKAAQDLFDSIEKTMVDAAHKIQTDVTPMIAASLNIQNKYDKKGNVTSTTYGVTIGGKSYTEDSQDKAVERIQAEAVIAQVAASKIGADAGKIAEQWRASADTLFQGANFLLAATADITRGVNLLGDGGTLSDIADVVNELAQGSEELTATYQRLGQETQVIQTALSLTGVDLGKTGKAMVEFADGVAQAAGGVDQLTQMVTAFNQAFFTPAELAQAQQAQLSKASDTALKQIGEDPLESMSTFKAHFLAALPTLTPEQLEQWYAAGVALANYTKTVTDSAKAYASLQVQLHGDEFISAMASVVAAEQQQIDQANEVAKAAGRSGASQADLAVIMTQGSAQIGSALAKLTQGIAADVAIINGAANAQGNGPDDIYAVGNNKAAVQAAAQQQQAQQAAAAYDIITKAGDYVFASGKSITDVLKSSGTTAEQLAKILGISLDQVNKQIQAAADNAASLTKLSASGDEQVGLLQDILDVLQGRAPSYDISALGAPPVVALDSNAGGKLGGPNKVGGPASGRELTQAVSDGNKGTVDETRRVGDLLEQVVRLLGGNGRATINRNTAGGIPLFIRPN